MAFEDSKLIQFLQDLIQIASLSGQEGAIVDRIQAEMRTLNYDHVWVDGNGSLVGIINGASAGRTLLLDAHCDTVGITAQEEWHHDPLSGYLAEGRMYGRGTSDMKGALAAMVYAAASVDQSRLVGQVVVSATVLEEVMEGIALQSVLDAVSPDCVVIGESTNLNLNHGGRGRAEVQLESYGKPAHSSNPQAGINAVHLMLPAIQAIEALPMASDPLLGNAQMTLTDMISDPYPGYSVIPSRCRVTYDRRLLVGETPASVLAALQQAIRSDAIHARIVEGEHQCYTGAMLHAPKFFPAWKFPAEHPFVQAALSGLQAAGLNPQLGAYSFCTNGASSAGVSQIPTIGFGPSQEHLAHIINEYIEIEQLLAAARGYQSIIEHVLQ